MAGVSWQMICSACIWWLLPGHPDLISVLSKMAGMEHAEKLLPAVP